MGGLQGYGQDWFPGTVWHHRYAYLHISNQHNGQLLVMLLRALLVTWLGFMMIRQINPLSLVHFFRQRGAEVLPWP